MADPKTDLTTSSAATTYLQAAGLPVPSDLDAIVTGVSAEMQSYASRNFVSQDYSVTLNGLGGVRLVLPNTPVTAVKSLTIGNVTIPAAADPVSWGYIADEWGVWLRGYDFCRGIQNVALTYTAGYAVIPMDLQEAALEAVAAYVAARANGDPRAIVLKAGGSQITYAKDNADLAAICFTANVTSVLNQRRRVAPI